MEINQKFGEFFLKMAKIVLTLNMFQTSCLKASLEDEIKIFEFALKRVHVKINKK